MCYHNSINTDTQNLERKYKKRLKDQAVFKPVFHASGFEFLQWPIITPKGENIELMNWGLIPNWVNTPTAAREIKSKTLNARIETVDEKPSFRNAQRCIIPSTGFFEWQTVGKEKIPYFIYLPENQIFSMAGLYDTWINEAGIPIMSFGILTTDANPLMEKIHNTKKRMPVILDAKDEENWLFSKNEMEAFKRPFPETKMKAHVIGNIINSTMHNIPEVSLPQKKEVSEQLNLF